MIDIKNLHPKYIIDENGKKTSVIIPFSEFVELLEDIEDLAIAAERREEPTISHEDLLKELKEENLV
ncbi:MAG: hypothetical protein LWW94_11605 [Candidatus Desulfofervidaceae bacterium]|nr:hypothetical protein [Candidatus Desulfofervidaceae bacterium]